VLKALHFVSNDYWLFVEVRNLINQIYGVGSFEKLATARMVKKFTNVG